MMKTRMLNDRESQCGCSGKDGWRMSSLTHKSLINSSPKRYIIRLPDRPK
jgi:hypothetical protein